MTNQVFANGMEIACKAAVGKVIAAFPDVCMTPPENPATPPGVPVPYPNTAFASDTSNGSKSVKISDKEIMLKNKSYFKTSTGDEAGCAAKKGVVSSKTKGKVYFIKWSMDVKVEGENVDRHFDMTTNNHGSPRANESIPWPYADSIAAFGDPPECTKQSESAKKKCKNSKLVKKEKISETTGRRSIVSDGVICSKKCKKAMRCILVAKEDDKDKCCKGDTTGHHLIEDHWVKGNSNFPEYRSSRGNANFTAQSIAKGPGVKTMNEAPCVCSNAKRSKGRHQQLHNVQGVYEESFMPGGSRYDPNKPSGGFNYGEGKNAALLAHKRAFKSCPSKCIEAQLDAFYGSDNDRPLNDPSTQPLGEEPRVSTIRKWGSKVSG